MAGITVMQVIIDRSAYIVLAEDNCHTMRRNQFYELRRVVSDTMAVNNRNWIKMTWICLMRLLLIKKGTSTAGGENLDLVGEKSGIIEVCNTVDIWPEVIDDGCVLLRNASLGMEAMSVIIKFGLRGVVDKSAGEECRRIRGWAPISSKVRCDHSHQTQNAINGIEALYTPHRYHRHDPIDSSSASDPEDYQKIRRQIAITDKEARVTLSEYHRGNIVNHRHCKMKKLSILDPGTEETRKRKHVSQMQSW